MSLATYPSSARRQCANWLKFLQAIREGTLGPYPGRTTSQATVKNSAPLFFREYRFFLKRRRTSGLLQCLWCQNPGQVTLATLRTSGSISPAGRARHLATLGSGHTFWDGVGHRQGITLGWKTLPLCHLLPEKHLKTPNQKPNLAARSGPAPLTRPLPPPRQAPGII